MSQTLTPPTDILMDRNSRNVDKGNFVWIICFLMGIGTLLTWNSFITPVYYWIFIYKEFPFMFYVGLVFNYPYTFANIYNVIWGKNLNEKVTCFCCFFVNMVLGLAVPLLNNIDIVREDWQLRLSVTFGIVALCGIMSALLCAKILSIVAILPSEYTGAFMSGNGAAGIITLIIFFISYFTVDINTINGANTSALIFFAAGSFISFLCIIGVLVLDKIEFYQYYKKINTSDMDQPLLNVNNSGKFKEVSSLGVLKIIWKQGLNVFLTFFVTLSVFPGLVAIVKPQTGSSIPPSLMGSLLIGTFQVFDFIGRTIPSAPNFIFIRRRLLWIPTVIRFIFFPLIIILSYPRPSPIVQNDIIAFTIILFFAITNGYFGTIGMIYGPSDSNLSEAEKPIAGTMMGFFLGIGILLGQQFGILLNRILFGSWI